MNFEVIVMRRQTYWYIKIIKDCSKYCRQGTEKKTNATFIRIKIIRGCALISVSNCDTEKNPTWSNYKWSAMRIYITIA